MMNKASKHRYKTLAKLINEQYQTRIEMCQKLAGLLEKKQQTSNRAHRTSPGKAINHAYISEMESLTGLTPEQILQHLLDSMEK